MISVRLAAIAINSEMPRAVQIPSGEREIPNSRLDLFKSRLYNVYVKQGFIRTSIDLPSELHRRLHAVAARKGCSARQLILAGLKRVIEENEPVRPRRRLSLDPPLIPPAGRCLDLTNEQIYDFVEFP